MRRARSRPSRRRSDPNRSTLSTSKITPWASPLDIIELPPYGGDTASATHAEEHRPHHGGRRPPAPDGTARWARHTRSAASCRVALEEQCLRQRHVGDLLRVHALVRRVDRGERLLDSDQRDLRSRGRWLRGRCRAGWSRPDPVPRHRPAVDATASPSPSPGSGPVRRGARKGSPDASTSTAPGPATAPPRAGGRRGPPGLLGRDGRRDAQVQACSGPGHDGRGRPDARVGSRFPTMVSAGRAHSMSATVPSPSSETPSSTPASRRNCSGG